jgi:hypothetical protein
MMNVSPSSPRQPRIKPLALLLAALSAVALNSFAAIPAPEKLLPDDTLVMLTAPDFTKIREISGTSPQTRLWNDPAMKPFRDKLMTRLREEIIQPLERDLGVRLSDYTNLLQGQVTFALTQNGWQGSGDAMPAALLLLDAKDKSAQLKSNLASLRKKWVAAGKTLKTENIRNLEFWVLPLSSNDVPKSLKKFLSDSENEAEPAEGEAKKEAPKDELVIGQVESLLIVGNSTKAVEKVVIHLTGGSLPALAELPDYEANRLALFRDAPLYGWINARAFITPLSAKPADNEAETPTPFAMFSPDKIIAATGLNSLKTVAFCFKYSSEGTSFQVFAGVPESGRQGLFKLFPSEARESGPPAFVPADAVKFQRWRMDGQKAWATLQAVLNDISPQLLSGLNFLFETANTAAKEKDPDFDIKKNLFGNLGDDLIGYEKAPRGNSLAEMNSAPSLFLIGSPRSEQLAAALKSVLVLVNQQAGTPVEREFLGRKIYSVKLPAVPLPSAAAGEPPRSRTLSYSASGGYVAISTDTALLEEYLRSGEGQQKALRESPGFADAISKVGGTSALCFGYENQAETARVALEVLRQTYAAKNNEDNGGLSGPYAIPFGDGGFKDWVDFSLLPPFEKLSKYFHLSVYSATVNADGLTFKMFAPTPPQLKK